VKQNIFNIIIKNWTSGNSNIDKFIQSTQLSHHNYKALKWIPYDKFYDIEYILQKVGLVKSIEHVELKYEVMKINLWL